MSSEHIMLTQEIRAVERTAANYAGLISLARQAACSGVLNAPVEARAATFRKLNRFVLDGMAPIKSRYDDAVSRSGRTSTHEACHVVIMPERSNSMLRKVRLVAVRLLLAHDEIAVEKLPLQSAFRLHAAERLFHRGEIESGCCRALGEEMLGWYYATKLAGRVLEEASSDRLVVPGPATDGLILGHLDDSAAVPAGELHRFGKSQESVHVIPASPFAPNLFSGNTYIGEWEVKPIQKELRECWLQWHAHYARDYQLGLEREVWPFRVVFPATRQDRVPPEAISALESFLLDPRAMAVMRNFHDESIARPAEHDFEADDVALLKAG